MSTWTLLHMRSPLNTVAGTGQYAELTKASSRKLTFASDDADTLSFDMPGNLRQTADISVLEDDVLVFRDDQAVQRFRIVSRSLSKENGVLRASFSGVSYRALFDARIFADTDTRSWAVLTEQTDIAWTLINQSQQKVNGDLGIKRGKIPNTPVMRQLQGAADEDGGKAPEYFLAGMKIGEALGNISVMVNGFEWDIQPDSGDPYRSLVFDAWNLGDRNQHAVRSPLVLDDGGSMMSWGHVSTPTDYGNVVRFTGAETTEENGGGDTTTPINPVWVPSDRNPELPAPEGRWERDLNDGDLTTQSAVNAAAPVAYDDAHTYLPEITATLRRGAWDGPPQLWIGDYARLIITEPVADRPGSYVLYVDENARVVELDVDVDDQGAEDVSLSLNRPKFDTKRNAKRLNTRLTRLERR